MFDIGPLKKNFFNFIDVIRNTRMAKYLPTYITKYCIIQMLKILVTNPNHSGCGNIALLRGH
jgi:hypothetical protein